VTAFFSGLLTGFSLIIAIGAQNAFVIRQGLTKRYVFSVVAICAISDALLIALGIGGLGAVIIGAPWLLELVRWFGVCYLVWFGIKSIISATKSQSLDSTGVESKSLAAVAGTALVLTFLKPHVYLDTVVFLGSAGSTFGQSRWYLGFGAMLASRVWFIVIGFGAKAASKFMTKVIFWRILDLVIAAVMFGLAITLIFFKP
jgi:L-lysine exporter family protein LysE/ArgO